MSASPDGVRPVARTFAAVAFALMLGALAGPEADASTGLDGLRLFATPERRAALDAADGRGGGPDDGGAAGAAVRPPDPSASTLAAPGGRGTTPSRPSRPASARADRPPAGSAVLRSARGVSRIVDGVPVRDDRP